MNINIINFNFQINFSEIHNFFDLLHILIYNFSKRSTSLYFYTTKYQNAHMTAQHAHTKVNAVPKLQNQQNKT